MSKSFLNAPLHFPTLNTHSTTEAKRSDEIADEKANYLKTTVFSTSMFRELKKMISCGKPSEVYVTFQRKM